MFSQRFVFNMVLILIFIALIIWYFSEIVLYVLISAIIATIIRPITDYIDNLEVFGLKIPRILAVIISFLILATVPLMFILLFAPLIAEQIQVLQGIDYDGLFSRISESSIFIENFIIEHFHPKDVEPGFLEKDLRENFRVFESSDVSVMVSSIFSYLIGFAGKILIYLLAVTFITFFLLYEKGIIRRNLLAIVPNAYFEVVVTTFYKIEKLLSNYLMGLLLQVGILFTIIALGLAVLGIKYALTIAVFAAIINLIPYIGPIVGYAFGILVLVSTPNEAKNMSDLIIIILQMSTVFAIAQLIDNVLLQPIIFSKSVKAHPLEIFISIFVGAALAGGLGMIAAIPMYTILRVSWLELSRGYRQYHIFRAKKGAQQPLISNF